MAVIGGANSFAAVLKALQMSFLPVMKVRSSTYLPSFTLLKPSITALMGRLNPLHGHRAEVHRARALCVPLCYISR